MAQPGAKGKSAFQAGVLFSGAARTARYLIYRMARVIPLDDKLSIFKNGVALVGGSQALRYRT